MNDMFGRMALHVRAQWLAADLSRLKALSLDLQLPRETPRAQPGLNGVQT